MAISLRGPTLSSLSWGLKLKGPNTAGAVSGEKGSEEEPSAGRCVGEAGADVSRGWRWGGCYELMHAAGVLSDMQTIGFQRHTGRCAGKLHTCRCAGKVIQAVVQRTHSSTSPTAARWCVSAATHPVSSSWLPGRCLSPAFEAGT